jgi:hypothetical protein
MRAYQTIRFTEAPDISDIQSEGRASHVGRLRRGEVSRRWVGNIVSEETRREKVVRSDRGYLRSAKKAAIRRSLKRTDRARSLRETFKEA